MRRRDWDGELSVCPSVERRVFTSLSPRRFVGIFSILLAGSFSALRADYEWRGMMTKGDGPVFALVDTASGTSKWVPLGGVFQGMTVNSYDPQRQLLVLARDGDRLELTLAAPRAASARPAASDLPANASPMLYAQTLANKGDTQMRDLLTQHRTATLKVEELTRRITELERAAPVEGRPAPGQPRPSSPTRAPGSAAAAAASNAEVEKARKDLETAEKEVSSLTSEIDRVVTQKRDAAAR